MEEKEHTPFDDPPIVLKKVTLFEVIERLQDTIPPSYMPSAQERGRYISKARYLRASAENFLAAIAGDCSWPGLYKREPLDWIEKNPEETFAAFPIGDYVIAINLLNLKGYVMRWVPGSEVKIWDWPADRDLALDRGLFNEVFTNF